MQGHATNPAAIEAEIVHLRSFALDALRRHWRVIFGRTPPAALRKDLLGRMIAYRLQERAFGGLDRESLRFLHGLARHGGSPRRRLKPGTVLVRDYQGQRHTVTVISDANDRRSHAGAGGPGCALARDRLRGWGCEIRTQKCRRKLSL
jgi:hypothetical protein